MNFSSQNLFILRSILLLIWGILYTPLQKYALHILSFLTDSRWIFLATLHLEVLRVLFCSWFVVFSQKISCQNYDSHMSIVEKCGSHIVTFLADSRWMLVATLRLINRWKACSSPNASSNQDTVANFLRGWKIVISNLDARGPLELPSKSRLFLHVNEFLFFHQFLLTPTLFTRHTNQRIWYLNHFVVWVESCTLLERCALFFAF